MGGFYNIGEGHSIGMSGISRNGPVERYLLPD